MDRRDFVKLASGFLVAPAVANSLPAETANAATGRIINGLPKTGFRKLAMTIDDGASSEAIEAYLNFARTNNVKLNFFITSKFAGWRPHENEIKQLHQQGLLQIANHTGTHANLSKLSSRSIKDQLMRCHHYIEDAFGVDARPYFRPPFGAYNSTVLQAAASIGYSRLTLWNGTLADSSNHTRPFGVRKHARSSFKNGKIVLMHANRMLVPDMLPELYRLIQERELTLVKLDEVL